LVLIWLWRYTQKDLHSQCQALNNQSTITMILYSNIIVHTTSVGSW
jgi:hypothetical protein